MFNKMTVFASFAVVTSLIGTARADGIDFTPIGQGGVQWTVSAAGFDTPFHYGTLTAQAYSVPYAVQPRSGCFVVGPKNAWLPVTHGDGWGNVFPEFYSTWEAVINKRQPPNATVFTLQVEIRSPSGATNVVRKPVSSGLYNLFPIYFPTPDTILYFGDLDSSLANASVVQTFDVHENDQYRVSVCDLAAESTIDVRKLVIQTFPRDGQ